MNFKETFIKLTEYTVPFGYEQELEYILPKGYKKDTIGNYYYEIGKSKTLFTSHLDTASLERKKINHIIDSNIIKTDGTTILGGDNKAGCLILFYMIENKIPGVYYFFIGEEMSVHNNYPFGSLMAIEENSNYFSKFNRAISFDRKETNQMVIRQLGRNCCSEKFADELIKEFSKSGTTYEKDRTGYYTDSAFFGDLIPEIVNLSCGVWNEHTNREYVDISYIEKVAKSSIQVDWESLITERVINHKYTIDSRKDMDKTDISDDAKLFGDIFNILDELYYVCHEFRSYQNFLYNFKPGRFYHFTKWHDDVDLEISIKDNIIICNNIDYENLEEFKNFLGMENMDPVLFSKMMLDEFKKNGNKLSDAKFHYLTYLKNNTEDLLSKNIKNIGYKLNKIGKGYEIIKEEHKYIMTYEKFKNK